MSIAALCSINTGNEIKECMVKVFTFLINDHLNAGILQHHFYGHMLGNVFIRFG